jgi:hypothetical protein
MENTETPEIQSFIKEYNEWLEARPKSDDVEFVHYSHLVILIGEDDESLKARNLINSDVHKINFNNLIAIHESMKNELDKQAVKHFQKSKQRLSEKNP